MALLLLFSLSVVAKDNDTAIHKASLIKIMNFDGAISKEHDIEAIITFSENNVLGYYRYPGDKEERGKLEGSLDGEKLEFNAYDWGRRKGIGNRITGHFSGIFDGHRMKGVWVNVAKEQKNPFQLRSLTNSNSPDWRMMTDASRCDKPPA